MAKVKHNGQWIETAKIKKGAFTATAKRAGKSVGQEITDALKPGSKASAKTKKRAQLAKTFRKMARKRKGPKREGGAKGSNKPPRGTRKRPTNANMPGDEAGKAM